MHIHKTSGGNPEVKSVMMRAYIGGHYDAPRVKSLDFEGFDMATVPGTDNALNLQIELDGRTEFDFPVRVLRTQSGTFRILSMTQFGQPHKKNGFQTGASRGTDNHAALQAFWDVMFAPTKDITVADFLHSDMVRVLMAKGSTYADASLQARMWIQLMYMPQSDVNNAA